MQTDFSDSIRSQECVSCGITFAVTATFEEHLRETKRSFQCPNGHAQSYEGKLEVEKLREQIAELERTVAARDEKIAYLRDDIAVRDRANRSLRGVITKLKRKAAK